MGLTGGAFLAAMVALTVAAFATAVAGLPRLSGPGVLPGLGRAAVLMGLSLLTLLCAAVGLNDRYTFYADWTDLHGAIAGASADGQSINPAPDPVLAAAPPATGSNADLRFVVTVTGAGSGLTGSVLVTLPPGYYDPGNAERRYPVLETFNGYPGDPSQWVDNMGLDKAIGAAASSGVLAQTITVSPLLEFPKGVDTECVDGPGAQPKVETWVADDVVAWAEASLRAQTGPGSWATIGLSAGGWCAAMAAMLHPEEYGAAIEMGGYFEPEFSKGYRPFAGSSPQAKRYDLLSLERRSPPNVALWVETSKADSLSYPTTSNLPASAQAPLSVQARVLVHAGHRLDAWSPDLPQALAWLGARLTGFSVSSQGTAAGPAPAP